MKSFKWGALSLWLVIALHATVVGAGPPPNNEVGQRTHTLKRTKMKIYDALKIAVETLEERKLMYRSEYKLRAAKVGDEWVFWFVFLPETPGLDMTVFVSDDGQIRFLPGF